MTPERIELMIDELLLEGLGSEDRESIRADVERQLTRLFLEQGIPLSLIREAEIDHLEAGSISVDDTMGSNTIGTRIARTLYKGLVR
jgi:hypothetical protein